METSTSFYPGCFRNIGGHWGHNGESSHCNTVDHVQFYTAYLKQNTTNVNALGSSFFFVCSFFVFCFLVLIANFSQFGVHHLRIYTFWILSAFLVFISKINWHKFTFLFETVWSPITFTFSCLLFPSLNCYPCLLKQESKNLLSRSLARILKENCKKTRVLMKSLCLVHSLGVKSVGIVCRIWYTLFTNAKTWDIFLYTLGFSDWNMMIFRQLN